MEKAKLATLQVPSQVNDHGCQGIAQCRVASLSTFGQHCPCKEGERITRAKHNPNEKCTVQPMLHLVCDAVFGKTSVLRTPSCRPDGHHFGRFAHLLSEILTGNLKDVEEMLSQQRRVAAIDERQLPCLR